MAGLLHGTAEGAGVGCGQSVRALLTKHMRGTPYLSACRHTVSLCGSTPATESNSATAPSSTRSARSTCISTAIGEHHCLPS
jgi:hypothetical protein